jgi:hypothetical protein
VVERKKQHIKGKLQDKFSSAESCFSALDEDGGGSLDRFFRWLYCLNFSARSHLYAELKSAVDCDSAASGCIQTSSIHS